MDINGQIKKINMMSPGIERSLNIHYLCHYLYYLLDSGKITTPKFYKLADKVLYNSSYKTIPDAELDYCTVLLTCLYEEVLKYANNYETFYVSSPMINFKELESYAIEFFKSIDINLYNIYKEMKDNGLISIVDDINRVSASGETMDIGIGKSGIIVANDNSFYSIESLVHEMGHAYDNYMSKSFPKLKHDYIERECISVAFQYLFREFLRKHHLVKRDILDVADRNGYMIHLYWMNNAYIFNNYYIERGIPNYANIVESRIVTDDDKEYDDLGILKTNRYLRLIHDNIVNDNNYYCYGMLYALIIRKIFNEDEKEAIKLLKDFAHYANTHEGHEIITRFTDDEYLEANKEYADKVLSKTHYKNT